MSDSYKQWALELIGMFFSPSLAGQQVRLAVSQRMLDETLPNLGGSQGLLKACVECPIPGGQSLPFHEKARRLYNIWRLRPENWPETWKGIPDGAPFYLPHLAVLCMAWTVNDDELQFTANAYYDRLNSLLPANDIVRINEMKRLRVLWEGLEIWTKRLQGRRGSFKIQVVGPAHVGIPLGQVLFTPEKIARLPELFVSTELAVNWQNITLERLRNVILQHPSLSQRVLGTLYKKILNNNTIGEAVINRVLEELQHPQSREWTQPIEFESGKNRGVAGGGQAARPVDTIRLRCVLEAVNSSPPAWRCHLGIQGEEPPTASPEARDWRYRSVVSGSGGLWLVNSEQMDNMPGPFEGGDYLCPGQPGLDEEDVRMRQFRQEIRLFSESWASPTLLVEKDNGLPDSGGCFALVSGRMVANFVGWSNCLTQAGGSITDYSRAGLPDGSRFFHLGGLERLGAADRLSFSESEPSLRRTTISKAIRLVGGSQVHGAGRHGVYLPYDLPDVELAAPAHVRLEADPEQVLVIRRDEDPQPEAEGLQAGGLPGNISRSYRLELTGACDVVRLHAISDNPAWTGQMASFALAGGFLPVDVTQAAGETRFDEQGRRFDGSGILGCMIDDDASGQGDLNTCEWEYEIVPFDLGRPAAVEDASHPVWRMLESLAHAAGGKVAATEFRRRCEKQLEVNPRIVWREARWLRALCHVEVERDDRARIKLVHRVPPQAYLLPWRAEGPLGEGLWITVVAGCPTSQQLQHLLSVSANHGVQVMVKDRDNPLLPPRWLCACRSLDEMVSLFAKAGFDFNDLCAGPCDQFTAIPSALRIARWSNDLSQWRNQLDWQPDLAMNYELSFNPITFQQDVSDFHCPCRLVQKEDSLTRKHKWHLISHSRIDQTAMDWIHEHAYLVDYTWGRWLSCRPIADEFGANEGRDLPTPVPYIVAGHSMQVPGSMPFPAILSRALVLCSGMPPAVERNSPYYSSNPSLFTPDPEKPYPHAVLNYEHVPQAIAEAVCAKVSARIVPQHPAQPDQS